MVLFDLHFYIYNICWLTLDIEVSFLSVMFYLCATNIVMLYWIHLLLQLDDNKMYLLESQPDSGGHDHLTYSNITLNGSQIFSFSVTYVAA